MSTAWRVPRSSRWRIKRRLSQPTTRDRWIAASLVVVAVGAAATCSYIGAHSKASFGDPGGPFVATIIDKEIGMPSWRQMFPVRFFLVVREANGHQRRLAVGFRDYARGRREAVMTRNAASTLAFR